MLKELQINVTTSSNLPFWTKNGRARQAGVRCSCRSGLVGRMSRSLRVVRRQPNPSHHLPLVSVYAEHYDQGFTVEPDRVAVDEKQIQLAEEEKAWLYAAIDIDSKVVCAARLSQTRGTKPATTFLRELKEEHRVADAEFFVNGMGYLTALAKTDLTGDLNYSERNIVEKLFQTYTMRVGQFRETWNGSQPALGAWLTAYYNQHRSHQALENQTPIEALQQKGPI